MTDQHDMHGRESSDADSGFRLKLKGIVESGASGGEPAGAAETPVADYRARPRSKSRARWAAASRQTMLVTRLAAVFMLFAVAVGWPAGDWLAWRERTGGAEGWSYFAAFDIGAFLLAVFVPMLTLLVGYIMSRQQQMMSAAEDIAAAARVYARPDEASVAEAMSVGEAVRGQMEALSAGLDGALTRLASVEAMIRAHVEAIEHAGVGMEERAAGAAERIADERVRLIELTENLNTQADAFANAIAEKAQASVHALHTADDVAERAQHVLEERLGRLDAAAQTALASFNALTEALRGADETMRASTAAIDSTAAETLAATDRATKASEAAAEAAARNAANVGAAAARASKEAQTAAEAAIETAAREAERASKSAYEAAEREARRVSEAAHKVLGDVKKATGEVLGSVADDTGKAARAAEELTAAARRSAEAAVRAAADVAKASEDAGRQSETALSRAEENAKRMETRNAALAEARKALEAENTRLETLIDEQRKRADRLAEAIAGQTERLSKLAESQLREQEANARLAAAQAALRAREEAAARAARQEAEQAAARKAAAEKAAAEEAARAEAERKAAEAKAAAEKRAAEEAEAAAAKAAAEAAEKAPRGGAARDAKKPGPRPADPDVIDLGAADRRPAQTARARAAEEARRRDKDKTSWREILDATDSAEPLDLASASVTAPEPSRVASEAIRIISRLQAFTFDLETRLYGEPPQTLRERFEHGDRNVFANRLLRLNEADVKRRIRTESARDKVFEREIHEFLQGFERLLEDATTSETADEDLEEYLSSPLGRVYLLIGATVGYFA